MTSHDSPTIEQLIERMPTDRVLALLINQLLELRTEVELIQRLIVEQVTAGMDDGETKAFVKRLSERRMSLLAAMTGEWRARAEEGNGQG